MSPLLTNGADAFWVGMVVVRSIWPCADSALIPCRWGLVWGKCVGCLLRVCVGKIAGVCRCVMLVMLIGLWNMVTGGAMVVGRDVE